MPTQALLDELLRALQSSKNFQLLAAEKQSELKSSFATATDPQLTLAMEEVKKDALEQAKREAAISELVAKQAELIQKFNEDMKAKDKEELKKNEAIEMAESAKKADELMASLEKISGSGEPEKKRKKFLGLF